MDFQNRVGSKPGSGGVAGWSESNIDRRERLRKLALETINLATDPYILRNHLGSYECKLCLTLHTNEGSYLAHTQGKKHQTNLARRAAKEARDTGIPNASSSSNVYGATHYPSLLRPDAIPKKQFIKIGRPGYKVVKIRDPTTRQLGLLFSIHYPQIVMGVQPRHRFMSAFEQRVESPDRAYQYLVIAAEPYESIAFKVPSKEIDKGEGRFFAYWDKDAQQFTVQMLFRS